ncbi:hypothetical protein Tco_0795223 [Tanacetum coccineum]
MGVSGDAEIDSVPDLQEQVSQFPAYSNSTIFRACLVKGYMGLGIGVANYQYICSLLLQLPSGSCWNMLVGSATYTLEIREPIGGTCVKHTDPTSECSVKRGLRPQEILYLLSFSSWLWKVFHNAFEEQLGNASGLKINIHKSNIYGIGVNKDEVLSMASNAGCMAGDVPFNYLGLPIGSNMKSIASWKTLVDHFHMSFPLESYIFCTIGGV